MNNPASKGLEDEVVCVSLVYFGMLCAAAAAQAQT